MGVGGRFEAVPDNLRSYEMLKWPRLLNQCVVTSSVSES